MTIELNHYTSSLTLHYIPIQDPAVALESTAMITPSLNLNPSVVVPWSNFILTSLLSDETCDKNSIGYRTNK